MPEHAAVTYADLTAALAAMRLGSGASELHGSLSGYVCGGGQADATALLSALELESDAQPDDAGRKLLGDLYAEIRTQLDDPELGFEPLLPDVSRAELPSMSKSSVAESTVAERGDALVDWCRGFLGGLGLGGFSGHSGLSEEGKEILHDLDAIAASHFSYDDADDEASLTELFEFVRIGVLLLYAELHAHPHKSLH